jgi:hypothetical protein
MCTCVASSFTACLSAPVPAASTKVAGARKSIVAQIDRTTPRQRIVNIDQFVGIISRIPNFTCMSQGLIGIDMTFQTAAGWEGQ